MLKGIDPHIVVLGIAFFGLSLSLAVLKHTFWPVGAGAIAIQFPLLTRTWDKRRGSGWRPYLLGNELLVLLLAGASTAIVMILWQ